MNLSLVCYSQALKYTSNNIRTKRSKINKVNLKNCVITKAWSMKHWHIIFGIKKLDFCYKIIHYVFITTILISEIWLCMPVTTWLNNILKLLFVQMLCNTAIYLSFWWCNSILQTLPTKRTWNVCVTLLSILCHKSCKRFQKVELVTQEKFCDSI